MQFIMLAHDKQYLTCCISALKNPLCYVMYVILQPYSQVTTNWPVQIMMSILIFNT